MTGGNQLKLSAVVSGTAFGERAQGRPSPWRGHRRHVGRRERPVVAHGRLRPGGATPKQRMTQLAAGLGLLDSCVIDQHFAQRNRYGRLLTLVAQSPSLLGIGVDEDTAAVVTEDRYLEVVGRGAVTIFDGQHMTSNAHRQADRAAARLGCPAARAASRDEVRSDEARAGRGVDRRSTRRSPRS